MYWMEARIPEGEGAILGVSGPVKSMVKHRLSDSPCLGHKHELCKRLNSQGAQVTLLDGMHIDATWRIRWIDLYDGYDATLFVLFGATQKNISKLQKAQNLLARVVTCSQSCSPRILLQQLHWLPIKHRIDFKIANITFLTLHCSQPAYLHSSLHACHSTRSLRLSNTNLLSAPFVRTSFGSRSFSVAATKIWNSLHLSLRTCTSPDTFRRHLKTHYCQQAFHSS